MTDRQRTYLVECYLPGIAEADVAAAGNRFRFAVEDLRSAGHDVTYLGALFLATDEAVFHQLRAADAAVVIEAARRAGVAFERVVESIGVGAA